MVTSLTGSINELLGEIRSLLKEETNLTGRGFLSQCKYISYRTNRATPSSRGNGNELNWKKWNQNLKNMFMVV
mgnify:CR=1 FL=1